MAVTWSDLTFTPDEGAVQQLRSSWRWLLGDDWSPILFSTLGDVFLSRENGIAWLNTGTGEVSLVAANEDEFREMLAGDAVTGWFMPSLVAELREQGKILSEGECYTYAIYPIFKEGGYQPANFTPVPARSHFGLSGDLHQQIANLADGAQVRVNVVP